LLGNRLGDLVAPMANLAVPKAPDPIDVFVAFVVPQERAFTPHNAHKISFSGLGEGV
jgi:hypothetical protein